MSKTEALEILESAMNEMTREFELTGVANTNAYYAAIAPVSAQILAGGF
jgi:hypothetical protein